MNFLSLFSGIEAASQAWHPLGWRCVGFSEIERFPSELLKQRWPGVPNLGDVTKITEDMIAALGPLDLVVFGSPCQDLSVAGKRKGLAGERSGLFHTAIQIIGWARKHCGLRGALWENVPGAFTSNAGADFAAVVDLLSGLEPGTTRVPEGKKWGTEGAAVGPLGMVEWSTLDAQWFGVAQRRRRVFALADFGDWAGRPPVLLEPQGMRGDSAPRRGAREDAAGTPALGVALRGREGGGTAELGDECAGTLRASAGGGDKPHALVPERGPVLAFQSSQSGVRLDDVHATLDSNNGSRRHNGVIVTHEVVSSLDASFDRLQGCSGQDMNHGHSHLVVEAFGGNNTSEAIDVAPALLAQGGWKGDFESETFIAQTLCFDTTQITHPENRSKVEVNGPAPTLAKGGHPPTVAFSCKDYAADASTELAPTLRAMGHANSHANAGGQLAVAVWSQDGITADPLCANEAKTYTHEGAFNFRMHNCVSPNAYQVRRLTPTECERLQGMRDGYTAIKVKGKPAADGPRYKALGNSMAVPVMHWIGRQLDFAWRFF